MKKDKWSAFYFEENRNAYTKDMLDKPVGKGTITVREYLKFGIDNQYVIFNYNQIDSLTDEQICQAVDTIDYLESK